MNRVWISFLLLTCLLFNAGPSLLWAEEKIRVKEVVVTATRTEAEAEKIPGNVTVITQEKIRESNARTVQELLREEEGLIVKDLYGSGSKATVDMRGFDRGLNTVVLVDGIKVNEIDLSGVDWNLIPVENVERIEIVRGSGSVLYGDNAMAGTINIITKKGTSLTPRAEIDLRAESYGGNAEQVSFQVATEKTGFFGMLKNRWTNGYRDNSEFGAQDAAGNFSVIITQDLLAELKLGYHTDQQGYPGSLTASEIRSDRRQSTEPDNGAEYEQYFYGIRLLYTKPWGDIEAGYHFNSREFSSEYLGMYSGTPYSYDANRDTDKQELKLKIVIKKSLFRKANRFVVGIDHTNAEVNDKSIYADPFFSITTMTELRKRETGIYLQDELFLSDKLSVIAGYRHTRATFKNSIRDDFGGGKGSQSFNEDAYKIGISFNYTDGAKLFANYSRGFRLPTTDELFGFNGVAVIVADLKPETADTYEIGVVHPLTKKIIGRLTLYRMDIRDELFLNPSAGLFGTNENIDKTKHQGFELGFNAAVSRVISLFGNWTYSEVTFESGTFKGKTIPLRPRNTVNLGADIQLMDRLLMGIKANWTDKRYVENDVLNDLEKLDDFLTVDARVSYTCKMVTAYAGVNNIFNEKYVVSGGVNTVGLVKYLPAPERNFFAGLTFRF